MADGDETVIAASAKIDSANIREFAGILHKNLPRNPEVMEAIFNTLGIQYPSIAQTSSAASQDHKQTLVLALFGPGEPTVTDPLGHIVGPNEVSIPGAEYVSDPSDPFKLIVIQNAEEGGYDIDVQGTFTGTYSIALLDTFTPPPVLVTDVETLWDTSISQIQPDTSVTFALTYTQVTSDTTSIIAVTPVIEVPVWVRDTSVNGRALPGSDVEIRDADTQAILGSGMVDASGHFEVSLPVPLGFDQRIYPWSNGVSGVAVTVESHKTYLPILQR
jgi:hypothetical protein